MKVISYLFQHGLTTSHVFATLHNIRSGQNSLYRSRNIESNHSKFARKYIGLAQTDFNKNTVFYKVYMWLQLSQIKKKFTEGNARKPAFIYYADVTKIRKTRLGGDSFKQVHYSHMTPCIACEKARVN